MDADNLTEIGHHGFTVDAQAMTALLFDFATHADYRAAVKKEFDGIQALFGEYPDGAEEDVHGAGRAGAEVEARDLPHVPPSSAGLDLSGETGAGAGVGVAERTNRDRMEQLVVARARRARLGLEGGTLPRLAWKDRLAGKIDRRAFAHPRRAREQCLVGHEVNQLVPDRPFQHAAIAQDHHRQQMQLAVENRGRAVNQAWPVARS